MAENSKIGWTTHTFNPWWGCDKVSPECKFCYIDALMRRAGKEPFKGPMRTVDWKKPFKWNRRPDGILLPERFHFGLFPTRLCRRIGSGFAVISQVPPSTQSVAVRWLSSES